MQKCSGSLTNAESKWKPQEIYGHPNKNGCYQNKDDKRWQDIEERYLPHTGSGSINYGEKQESPAKDQITT